MAGEVSAVDGALKQGAQAVSQSRTELKSELNSLEGKLASIGSGWTGQGAVAFNQLMTRWREDATKMVSALDEFEQNLNASGVSYDTSDDQQSAGLNALTARLG